MRVKKHKTVDMIELKYTQLPGGLAGWQDPNKFRPLPFDLVELETHSKKISGWWTGNNWMGLRLREEDNVISWKKTNELNFI